MSLIGVIAVLATQAAPVPALAAAPDPSSEAADAPDTGDAPTVSEPPMTGRGEREATRDPATAFSSGQTEAAPADQSATPTGVARFQRDNSIGRRLRALKAHGVDLALDVVANVAGNPIGGVRQGVAESHWVSSGADIDLEKLLGWSDTKLHVHGAWFSGDSLGRDYIGNSISFQQTWRPVPGPRLTQFNIEHDFGPVNVMVGRAAVNTYYNNSPLNCVFMSNTSCLTAYGGISDIGITAFPNSSWAAKIRYAIDTRAYVQLGVFDYNNDLNVKGKGGLDFSLGKGTGALIAGEAGYQTTFEQERLPRRYKVGFYLNTDGGQSQFYDRNGRSSALTGLPRDTLDGHRVGLYTMADQTVSRSPGKSKRNLALFGRAFVNVGNVQQIDWFASAGFVKTGTFKRRDNDTIGFLVSNTHFSEQQINYLRDLRAKAGGSGSPKANEIIAELNYGFAALPGMRIMPNLQYVVNPDPIYAMSRATKIPDALVFGLRIDIKLAQLFGS
jgi:porin